MSKRKFSERAGSYGTYDFTPKKRDYEGTENKQYLISEWKLAVSGLIVSVVIILTKIYYMNREYIHNVIIDRDLVKLETITENGEIMFTYAWKESVKYSRYWLPMLCGALTTFFTWLMVYLDSNVPGIQPPSPLSPTRYKRQSGHVFHLNYVFALAIGILVCLYMFWKGISL